MSPKNICFEQKYEKYQNFLSENFPFVLFVKFSIYLNRRVFIMNCFSTACLITNFVVVLLKLCRAKRKLNVCYGAD